MSGIGSITCKRLDHTAVVVASLDEAIPRWQHLTGARLSTREIVKQQRVEIAMLEMENAKIELVCPSESSSGVARYLEKRGESLHHLGLEVDNITETIAEMSKQGLEFIDRTPRPGAHGMIAFIHPRSTGGVLVELIQCDDHRDPREG